MSELSDGHEGDPREPGRGSGQADAVSVGTGASRMSAPMLSATRGWPGGRVARRDAPEPSPRSQAPRSRIAPVGTEHHDRPVRGSLIAPLSRRAINGRNLASGHGQPLRRWRRRVTRQGRSASGGPAKRVDSVTAVALPAANRRGCWIVNRSDRAGSSTPPVPRFPDLRSPAETSRRAHFPRVRTEVVTGRSDYRSTYWYKRTFPTGQLGLATRDGRSRSKCCESALDALRCRHWPGSRFCRLSLPVSRQSAHGKVITDSIGKVVTFGSGDRAQPGRQKAIRPPSRLRPHLDPPRNQTQPSSAPRQPPASPAPPFIS